MKPKDLSGRQFGHWQVLSFAGINKHRKAVWNCRCVCGTERAVVAGDLRQHKSLCCGCVDPKKLPPGESSKRQVHTLYKYHARNRDYAWNLTELQFRALIESACHYCGDPAGNSRIGTRHNGAALYNGVDRVNNDVGYSPENCVPCCGMCNRAKANHDVGKYEAWVLRSANHIRNR
jgi:5-methylcytosine-specific restriction endonuclease McrA